MITKPNLGDSVIIKKDIKYPNGKVFSNVEGKIISFHNKPDHVCVKPKFQKFFEVCSLDELDRTNS